MRALSLLQGCIRLGAWSCRMEFEGDVLTQEALRALCLCELAQVVEIRLRPAGDRCRDDPSEEIMLLRHL